MHRGYVRARGRIATRRTLVRRTPFVAGATPPPGTRATLTASDISFLGYLQFSQSGIGEPTGLAFTNNAAALRRVGTGADQVRFFLHGRWGALYEYGDLTGLTPNLTPASAPSIPVYRDWGFPFGNHIRLRADDGSEAGSQTDGGLWWDSARNAVWKTYVAGYSPLGGSPGHVATVLTDATGAATPYGPWRTTQGSGFHSGSIIELPADIQSAYGYKVAGMGAMGSGISTKAFGPCLHPYNPPNPATTAAVGWNDGVVSFASGNWMQADETHQRRTATTYQVCGWNPSGYDCRLGAGLANENGFWGTSDPGTAENNNVLCGAWVQYTRATGQIVEGLIYFGFMVDTPPEAVALLPPGSTKSHMWYGDPQHASSTGSTAAGYVNGSCCHGQADARWGATGPGASWRDQKFWIFSRAQVLSTSEAGGSVLPSAIYPATTEAQRTGVIHPSFYAKVETFNQFGFQASFDAVTGRLYLTQFLQIGGVNAPVLAVFQVQ